MLQKEFADFYGEVRPKLLRKHNDCVRAVMPHMKIKRKWRCSPVTREETKNHVWTTEQNHCKLYESLFMHTFIFRKPPSLNNRIKR